MLWHSFGSIAALLQEVISVYPAINPPTLTVNYFRTFFVAVMSSLINFN
jgi:hypothetical protein